MLFTEFRFFPFFLLTFVLYWALRKNGPRKVWLVLCSYAFYAAWDWRFLSLIMLSTLIDFVAGLKIDAATGSGARKRWLLASLAANLGMLGFFKYFNFFIGSANEFLQLIGLQGNLSSLQLILPVGISFFTFQTMSYSLDIYFGKLKPTRSLLDLAFFVGFFPQLVAGPIVRAKSFLPQLLESRTWAPINAKTCLMIFLVGFIKKACVADNLAPFVDNYFEDPGAFTAISSWVAVTFYAVQIYCDFSGYSDMAIACAGLLGYELVRNFNFPYFAANITEFWRRWHMSLSSWLRDYLYIPLGGSRGNKAFTYRNLMLTMLLGGLWHGAAWAFVIWGGLHGAALIIHKEFTGVVGDKPRLPALSSLLGPVVTFYWVCVAWIFFRSGSVDLVARDRIAALQGRLALPDLGEVELARVTAELAELAEVSGLATALTTLESFVMFESAGTETLGRQGLLWVFAVLVGAHLLCYRRVAADWWMGMPDWAFSAMYGGVTAIVLTFVPVGNQPFIYFQF